MWSSLFFCRGITQLRSDIASSSRSFSTHAKCSTTHDPLRILFCGADDFSIYSLRALNDLKKRGTAVRSIDVVCKKDKRVGRGLKRIQEGTLDCFLSTCPSLSRLFGLTQYRVVCLEASMSASISIPITTRTAITTSAINNQTCIVRAHDSSCVPLSIHQDLQGHETL